MYKRENWKKVGAFESTSLLAIVSCLECLFALSNNINDYVVCFYVKQKDKGQDNT